MMNRIVLSFALALFVGCRMARSTDDIPVVRDFDAARYMGTWYEIARLPKWFEKGMTNVVAIYALDGETLKVTNCGWKDGKREVSTAVGHFAGPTDEGAFRVSFFRPFYGDYRIIWLSPEYDLSLVTSSDVSSLWILSRVREVAPERMKVIVAFAREKGFDVSNLEWAQSEVGY